MVTKVLLELLKPLLDKNEIFALINAANVNSPLLNANYVQSPECFFEFADKLKGIPIMVPADEKLFHFKPEDVFKISKNQILEVIYGIPNDSYVGFKHAFSSFEFLRKFEVRQIYKPYIQKVLDQNFKVISIIEDLKKKFKHIGAFQTRNIPHFGHEKIIQRLLEVCDHVVINPVVGPKKTGDVVIQQLTKIYTDLSADKYQGKISFLPVYCNMYYAGPREAIHHALIRQRIGFSHFTVGRDHAGADNAYEPEMATALIKENRKNLKINLLAHNGAAFCSDCNKVVIVDDCSHPKKRMIDISGSDFRTSLKEKRLFRLADKKMQLEIYKIKKDIFER